MKYSSPFPFSSIFLFFRFFEKRLDKYEKV